MILSNTINYEEKITQGTNRMPTWNKEYKKESQCSLTDAHIYGMLESFLMQHFDGGTFQLYMYESLVLYSTSHNLPDSFNVTNIFLIAVASCLCVTR